MAGWRGRSRARRRRRVQRRAGTTLATTGWPPRPRRPHRQRPAELLLERDEEARCQGERGRTTAPRSAWLVLAADASVPILKKAYVAMSATSRATPTGIVPSGSGTVESLSVAGHGEGSYRFALRQGGGAGAAIAAGLRSHGAEGTLDLAPMHLEALEATPPADAQYRRRVRAWRRLADRAPGARGRVRQVEVGREVERRERGHGRECKGVGHTGARGNRTDPPIRSSGWKRKRGRARVERSSGRCTRRRARSGRLVRRDRRLSRRTGLSSLRLVLLVTGARDADVVQRVRRPSAPPLRMPSSRCSRATRATALPRTRCSSSSRATAASSAGATTTSALDRAAAVRAWSRSCTARTPGSSAPSSSIGIAPSPCTRRLGLDRFGEIDPRDRAADGSTRSSTTPCRTCSPCRLPAYSSAPTRCRAIGGFDADVDYDGDDVDLCWRATQRRRAGRRGPAARVRHRERLEERRPELTRPRARAVHRMRSVVTLHRPCPPAAALDRVDRRRPSPRWSWACSSAASRTPGRRYVGSSACGRAPWLIAVAGASPTCAISRSRR